MTIAGAPDWLPNVRPQSDYDLLGTFTLNSASSQTFTVNDLAGIYQSLLCTIQAVQSFDVFTLGVQCTLTGTSYEDLTQLATALGKQPLAWVPFFNVPGDSVTCVVGCQANESGATFTIYGMRIPVPPNIRRDGRRYPTGSLVTSGRTLTTQTVIAAPTSPGRILVQSASVQAGLATAGETVADLSAVIGGAGTPLVQAVGTTTLAGSDRMDPPGGILCDPGQGVSLVVVTGPFATHAVSRISYDIVY